MTGQHELYNPGQSLFRRRRGLLWTVLTLVVVLVAGGVWYAVRPAPPVYVTDGSHVFFPRLGPIERMIRTENRWVRAQHRPYVSIAVMAPFSRESTDVATEGWLRHQLEGAYVEQLAANQKDGKSLPYVQLLLADQGSREKHWQDTVKALVSHTGAPDRLDAVTGLGLSVRETVKAIGALGKAGPIPMVGSVITADGITGKGLVRVSPTNSDETAAAVAYLRGTRLKALRTIRPLLVQDTNKDDTYAKTLGAAFRRFYPRTPETFDSSLPASATIFNQMQSDVCLQKPDVVFFAGRGEDLKDFLHALGQRTCTDRHLIVVTGDDASALTQNITRPLWDERTADFEVDYTALAHPGAWKVPTKALPASAVQQFGTCDECFGTLFPDESLEDGTAIMAHDAMATAVQAVRAAVTQQKLYPPPPAVTQEWNLMRGVQGASGWISFDGNSHGNPINKAVPIVRLRADGTTSFLHLSSATGTPPTGPLHE